MVFSKPGLFLEGNHGLIQKAQEKSDLQVSHFMHHHRKKRWSKTYLNYLFVTPSRKIQHCGTRLAGTEHKPAVQGIKQEGTGYTLDFYKSTPHFVTIS